MLKDLAIVAKNVCNINDTGIMLSMLGSIEVFIN